MLFTVNGAEVTPISYSSSSLMVRSYETIMIADVAMFFNTLI